MQAAGLAALAAHGAAEPLWQQAALDMVAPLAAALFGGLAVTLICQRVQEHRAELKQAEERDRAEQERRSQLSLDIMRVAFAFYTRLIEVTRVEHYQGDIRAHLGDLARYYENFRIDARVLEEQLRVYLPGGEARWLWHGVVDMLSLRYYRLVFPGPRLDGMIKTHGHHPQDPEIPESVRGGFLGPPDLEWADRVVFHDTVMQKFEDMLTRVINLVVHGDLEPAAVDPVVLSVGRGSGLGHATASQPVNGVPFIHG